MVKQFYLVHRFIYAYKIADFITDRRIGYFYLKNKMIRVFYTNKLPILLPIFCGTGSLFSDPISGEKKINLCSVWQWNRDAISDF